MMRPAYDNNRFSSISASNGFTLLEVSMVLLIMGLLLSSVMKPFGAQMIDRQRSATSKQLIEIRDALVGFAAANFRLPCPVGAGGVPEDCALSHGYVPAGILGIDGSRDESGLLLDSWGRPIRYSVTNSDGDKDGEADYTTVQGMQTAGMQLLSPDFEICDSSSSCVRMLANQVPVVLVSDGARVADPSADENENIDGDRRFVSRDHDQAGDDQFDDIVVWLSTNILYTRLIQARVLP